MSILGATRHERIDYKFQFENLSYDAGVHYQRESVSRDACSKVTVLITANLSTACVKISVFFKKLPNVSDEHFHQHWATVHADLTVASKAFNVYKIQRYIQVGKDNG